MSIDGVGAASTSLPIQPSNEGPQQVNNHESVRTGDRGQTREQDGDSIQISAEALQAAQKQEAVQKTVADEEIRADKVEEARAFLEAGLYNDEGVLDETAGRLQSAFEIFG